MSIFPEGYAFKNPACQGLAQVIWYYAANGENGDSAAEVYGAVLQIDSLIANQHETISNLLTAVREINEILPDVKERVDSLWSNALYGGGL